MKNRFVILDERDNVATALVDLRHGDLVETEGRGANRCRVSLAQDIAFGHKFATRPIARGRPVIKYGETIGTATAAIPAGAHVHVHNVVSRRGRRASARGPR